MWALVFACEALCAESSVLLFNSGIQEYGALKDRAAAQISWSVGRFNYINNRNGIRQSAVFADHYRERWAGVINSSIDLHVPISPAQTSSYVFEMDTPLRYGYPTPPRISAEDSYADAVVDESQDAMKHVNDVCSPCH